MKIKNRKKMIQKKSFKHQKKKFLHNKFSHHEVTMLAIPIEKKREILNIKSKSKTPILEKLPKLNDNKSFVISLIKDDPRNYKFVSDRLKNDISVALIAFELDGLLLEHAGDNVKKNRSLTSLAVKNNGLALQFAHPKYQDDNDIVAIAMHQNLYAKYFVGPKIKLKFYTEKKKQTLLAVKTDGTLLRFADTDLRNDFDIVLQAVHQNGLALEFASSHLKSDKFIVSEAVKQFSEAIVFAGPYLKNDIDIILLAQQNDPGFKNKLTPLTPWQRPYYQYGKLTPYNY